MDNNEYRFFRNLYKFSVNSQPIGKDILITHMKIDDKEFKSLYKAHKDYLESDKDFNIITVNKEGVKYMKQLIIDGLKAREIAVSPTSIKQFQKFGPNGFLKYYLKPMIKKTDDMIWGIALETYILTPKLFKDQFAVLNEEEKPHPDKDYRNADNQKWKKEFTEQNEGKFIISQADFNLIKECESQANVTNNFYMDCRDGEKQVKLEGEWKGLVISGIVDLMTDKIIYDLKKVQIALMDSVKWTIQRDYLTQITTYWWLEEMKHQCSFFCIDLNANCIEVGISEQRLAKELEDLKNYLNSLIKCIDGDYWDLGAEFHNGGKFLIW